MREQKQISVYVHIPFCESKCVYCDFYSIIRKDNVDKFLKALSKEIRSRLAEISENYYLSTIYFGGGSPSLLNPEHIYDILFEILSSFPRKSEKIEITLEANPGHLTGSKLREYLSAGVNRLSIGVQSFFDDDLKFLSRIHSSQEALKTIEEAHKAGFSNINIDLIFNLPGQTRKKWKQNLQIAASQPIAHVSPYSLIVEKGTILNKMIIDGKITIGDTDFDANLYELTMEFLSSRGFVHYEVSNFARPGYECMHNLAYWNYEDYIGFGPSARSFINKTRIWNYSSLNFYINSLAENNDATAGREFIDDNKIAIEFIMMGLRTGKLNLTKLQTLLEDERFYRKVIDIIEKKVDILAKEKFLTYDKTRKFLSLTTKGFLLCDEIILYIVKEFK